MTEYVILRKEPKPDQATTLNVWHELAGVIEASSPRRAVAAFELKSGEYIAVPARSWKQLSVKVEQTTKVTIS